MCVCAVLNQTKTKPKPTIYIHIYKNTHTRIHIASEPTCLGEAGEGEDGAGEVEQAVDARDEAVQPFWMFWGGGCVGSWLVGMGDGNEGTSA